MMKKFMTVVLTGIFAFSVSTNIYAYNGGAAATYAMNNWDNKKSNDYYFFSSDCTNFVSQCEKAGGVTVQENKIYTGRDLIPVSTCIYDDDTSYRYWYSKKKYSGIEHRNYYLLSPSWVNVREFRIYHNHHEGTAYSYSNNALGRAKLLKEVKPGDVIQAGDKHSVIITQIDSRTEKGVKYCGHSNNVLNKSISALFSYATNINCNTIYRISFKNFK